MSAKWVSRSLMDCAYHIGLCTSEKAFRRELRRMKIPQATWPVWIANSQSDATVHFFEHPQGYLAAIVCVRVQPERCGLEIAGLLVHEAVHIWQAHRDHIGESKPGAEQEAYAIQRISQRLMSAYADTLLTR